MHIHTYAHTHPHLQLQLHLYRPARTALRALHSMGTHLWHIPCSDWWSATNTKVLPSITEVILSVPEVLQSITKMWLSITPNVAICT